MHKLAQFILIVLNLLISVHCDYSINISSPNETVAELKNGIKDKVLFDNFDLYINNLLGQGIKKFMYLENHISTSKDLWQMRFMFSFTRDNIFYELETLGFAH